MAESVQQVVTQNATNQTGASRGKSKKIFVIMAVIILQIIAAYFLIWFLFNRGNQNSQSGSRPAQVTQPTQYRGVADPNFDHVYVVKDLVVNPAGTNGLRFLLATIGLEVTSEETVKELEKRDVQIHDSIIGILTSRTLPELDDPSLRDSLKIEIKEGINKDLTTGKVLNVYFSKFIIQ
jgi:flagellar basal body-associated protein FliL